MRTFAFAYNSVTPLQALQALPFLAARYEELEGKAASWTSAEEILDQRHRLPSLLEAWLLTPGALEVAHRRDFLEKVLLWLPPQVTAVVEDVRSLTGEAIRGYLISTWLLPEQHLTLPDEVIAGRILQVGRMAERLGASVLGLGAYTSIFPPGIPLRLQDQLSLTVTSGNCLTAAIAIQGIEAAAPKMNVDLDSCRIAVVGATGSIGGVCAEILARKINCSLTLVARTKDRLAVKAEKIRKATGREVHVTTDLHEALAEANVVLLATSSPHALVAPHHLATGSVVCDVSVPSNVSRDVASARDDVLVIDGGLVEVPGGFSVRSMHPYFGLPAGTTYACAGETMLLTLEDEQKRGLEVINFSADRVQHMLAVAAKHGFKLGQLRSFGAAVSEADVQLRLVKSGFRHRLAQLSMLEDLAQAMDTSEDLAGFFRLLLQRMVRLFKAEAASLWLVDPSGDRIVCEASTGPAGEQMSRFSVPIDTGIVGQVIASGVGQIVSSAGAHPAFNANADKHTGFRTRSMICSALPGAQGAIGAIQVLNRHGDGEVFTGQDLSLLSLLARSAAIMVRSAQQGERVSSGRSTRMMPVSSFVQRLDQELRRAKRYDFECSLLEVRLTWQAGTQLSELALAEFTSGLLSQIRNDDFACRLTPLRYLVFLPHTPAAGAALMVKRAQAKLDEKRPVGLTAIQMVVHAVPPGEERRGAELLEWVGQKADDEGAARKSGS